MYANESRCTEIGVDVESAQSEWLFDIKRTCNCQREWILSLITYYLVYLFINLTRRIYIYIYKHVFYSKFKIRFTYLSSGYDIGSGKKNIYMYNVAEC